MSADYRHLRADKLIETAEHLAARVAAAFPHAGLGDVARTIADVARNAVERAEKIRRPDWWLRGGLIGFGVLVVVLAGIGASVAMGEEGPFGPRFMDLMRTTSGAAVALSAVVVFLVTLETRLKRSRAVAAILELRSLAHIIDMHQLTKDSALLGRPDGPQMPSGDLMTAADISAYLHYCTALLSLLSKIGHLYVQDFADAPALAAVDQFEGLTTGLTQKIWQKLMILDRVQACDVPGPEPSPVI